MTGGIVYAQMHSHSKFSINPLSGEGVFHKHIWPLERHLMKAVMRTPKGLLNLANKKGVDFIAVTDHNYIPETVKNSDHIIIGEEWGQNKGHCNFIDLKEPIEPESGYFKNKSPSKPRDFQRAAIEAKKQGAFVSINHPFKTEPWRWGEDSFRIADALEIWNGKWSEENMKALELWQNLLTNGVRLWCMAGNDFHVNHLFDIGSQVVAFNSPATKSSLVEKLRSGYFSIAKDTVSPVVFIDNNLQYKIENFRDSIELRVVSSNSSKSIYNPEKYGFLERKEYQGFIRLELWENEGPLSFSNPIFL